MKLPKTGEQKVWESGAGKEDSQGRGRYDLVSTYGLRRLAKRYEDGAQKYAERNWEQGIPYMKLVDSMKRHLDQWIEHEDSEDHLAAVAFWAFALMHYEDLNMTEIDDRPIYRTNPEPTDSTPAMARRRQT